MIFQLTVYSLLLLFVRLLVLVLPMAGSGNRRPVFSGGRPQASVSERLGAIFADSMPVYTVFALWAVLIFLFGKPDLSPQYLAWAVVLLQVVRAIALYLQSEVVERLAGVVSVGILIYLWALMLPLFMTGAV